MSTATLRILPPEWRQFLEDTLTHRCQIEIPGTPSLEANPTPGQPVDNVPCYATRSTARLISPESRQQTSTWSVNLPRDCGVVIDAKILNVTTRQGDVLLVRGRVNRIDPEIDSDVGVIFLTAYVSDEE